VASAEFAVGCVLFIVKNQFFMGIWDFSMPFSKYTKTQCHVCRHKDRRAIDNAILEGRPFRGISKVTGISVGAISRHKLNHLAQEVAKSLGEISFESMPDVENSPVLHASVPPIEDIAAQIKYLYLRVVNIMASCEKEKKYHTAIVANRQALRCLDLFFKASEELVDYQNRTSKKDDVGILRREILKALSPYKEAKIEVAKAMLKITQNDKESAYEKRRA